MTVTHGQGVGRHGEDAGQHGFQAGGVLRLIFVRNGGRGGGTRRSRRGRGLGGGRSRNHCQAVHLHVGNIQLAPQQRFGRNPHRRPFEAHGQHAFFPAPRGAAQVQARLRKEGQRGQFVHEQGGARGFLHVGAEFLQQHVAFGFDQHIGPRPRQYKKGNNAQQYFPNHKSCLRNELVKASEYAGSGGLTRRGRRTGRASA